MIARLLKMVSGFGRGRSNAPTTPTRIYTPAATRGSERQFFEQPGQPSPPAAALYSTPDAPAPPIAARRGWRAVLDLGQALSLLAESLTGLVLLALVAREYLVGSALALPSFALNYWLLSSKLRADLRPYGSKYPPPIARGPELASSDRKHSRHRSALERAQARVRAANPNRASERRAS